jgi:hypothetical protein
VTSKNRLITTITVNRMSQSNLMPPTGQMLPPILLLSLFLSFKAHFRPHQSSRRRRAPITPYTPDLNSPETPAEVHRRTKIKLTPTRLTYNDPAMSTNPWEY